MTKQEIKHLHLKLKKDVLIVDLPRICDYEVFKHGIYFNFENGDRDFIEGNFTFLCKGEELTEEQCKELVRRGYYKGTFFNYGEPIVNFNHFDTAKDSFLSAISAQNHHWLKNPYKNDWDELCEWGYVDIDGETCSESKRYDEAESRTLKHPLIFIKN